MSKRVGLIALMVVLVMVIAVLAGCGNSSSTSSDTGTGDGSGTGTGTGTGTGGGKTYAIGEKASLKDGDITGEVTVSGVKTTNDMASPDADALLLTGPNDRPGANKSKSPASGKEFLLVTFQIKNTGTNMIGSEYSGYCNPSNLKLENAKGDSYDEVSTQGQGGIYNDVGIKPGEQSSVTAVYEVPQGETGLIETVGDSFSGVNIKFKIR